MAEWQTRQLEVLVSLSGRGSSSLPLSTASGCSAVVAHLSGGQGVAGSSPAIPTDGLSVTNGQSTEEAKVAEWQTRHAQNVVGLRPRGSSSLPLGTAGE